MADLLNESTQLHSAEEISDMLEKMGSENSDNCRASTCIQKPRGIIGHGLIGHAPQAPASAGTPQIGKRTSGPAKRHSRRSPRNLSDAADVMLCCA